MVENLHPLSNKEIRNWGYYAYKFKKKIGSDYTLADKTLEDFNAAKQKHEETFGIDRGGWIDFRKVDKQLEELRCSLSKAEESQNENVSRERVM